MKQLIVMDQLWHFVRMAARAMAMAQQETMQQPACAIRGREGRRRSEGRTHQKGE